MPTQSRTFTYSPHSNFRICNFLAQTWTHRPVATHMQTLMLQCHSLHRYSDSFQTQFESNYRQVKNYSGCPKGFFQEQELISSASQKPPSQKIDVQEKQNNLAYRTDTSEFQKGTLTEILCTSKDYRRRRRGAEYPPPRRSRNLRMLQPARSIHT